MEAENLEEDSEEKIIDKQELNQLLDQAQKVYQQNFPLQTWFGRCVFLSWYCKKGTCNFCYRSTIQHKIRHRQQARRSLASVLTDALIGKHFGWRFEFLTGGYDIFPLPDLIRISQLVSHIYQQKIWLNLGLFKQAELEQFKPFVEGICASIETVEKELHNQVCPDKPIEPYEEMLETAQNLSLKKSVTIVIGLGEKKQDLHLLHQFIARHKLDRITFYALKPVKGTPYTCSPSPEYYAWWIAQTRIRFPQLQIMAGLTPKKVDYTKLILQAGANSITKFPAIRKFNSPEAKLIEEQAKAAGRTFLGSLTKMPHINWDKKIDQLDPSLFSPELKQELKKKLNLYLKKIKTSS